MPSDHPSPLDDSEGRAAERLVVLRDEYQRLSTEIENRYAHHYQFHYAVVVLFGALSAIYFGLTNPTAKAIVLLGVPVVLFPIILLMLKEHAYMDLRRHYITTVLRPQVLTLLYPTVGDRLSSRILGWSIYEQEVIRGKGLPSVFFGVLPSTCCRSL
jgi:hypothetical protein